MSQWVRIVPASEMPAEGGVKAFEAQGTAICVARVHGRLAALNDVCPHQGASLSEGVIEDGRVVCSWHGWSFDPQTGAELSILWAVRRSIRCVWMATMCFVRCEGDVRKKPFGEEPIGDS